MNEKQLTQALINLENDKDFLKVMEWLGYERNRTINILSEGAPSESLQRLSGSLKTMTFLIDTIKEKQKR